MSQRPRKSPGQRPPGRRPKDLKRAPGPTANPRDRGRAATPRSAIGRSRVQPASTSRAFDPRFIALAGAALVLIVAVYIATGGVGGAGGAGGSEAPTAAPVAARSSNPPGCPTSQPASLPAGQTRTVTIQTSKGAIAIDVDGSLGPVAAGNFVALAQCGFYDGLVFHRLVPGFVIQGGDPNGDGSGGPGYTIADDPVSATYQRGTVAMARTQDPHSQGSQFFIVLSDDAASSLAAADPGYAILGEVSSGMDVVDAIAAMPNTGEPNNAAINPVAMTSVTVAAPSTGPSAAAEPSPESSAATRPTTSPAPSP